MTDKCLPSVAEVTCFLQLQVKSAHLIADWQLQAMLYCTQLEACFLMLKTETLLPFLWMKPSNSVGTRYSWMSLNALCSLLPWVLHGRPSDDVVLPHSLHITRARWRLLALCQQTCGLTDPQNPASHTLKRMRRRRRRTTIWLLVDRAVECCSLWWWWCHHSAVYQGLSVCRLPGQLSLQI